MFWTKKLFENFREFFSFHHFFNILFTIVRTWNDVLSLFHFERDLRNNLILKMNSTSEVQMKQQSIWYNRVKKLFMFNSFKIVRISLQIKISLVLLFIKRHNIFFMLIHFWKWVFLMIFCFFFEILLVSLSISISKLNCWIHQLYHWHSWLDKIN